MTTVAPQAVAAPAFAGTNALPRQFVRFVVVGVVNTALFLGLYLLLRTVSAAVVANLMATVLTTVAGTRANGKLTFSVKGPINVLHHAKSLAVTGLGMVITTTAVSTVGSDAGQVGELLVLIVASAAAGALRFVLLRRWVFPAA